MVDRDRAESPVDPAASLEEIDGERWGDPPPGATRLVATVHAVRRRPVGSLTVEELRLLLAQQVGVAVLVPLALERVEQDPLAEGDFYPGDLLVVLLRLPLSYWSAHPGHRDRLDAVATRALILAEDPDLRPGVDLEPLVEAFRWQR